MIISYVVLHYLTANDTIECVRSLLNNVIPYSEDENHIFSFSFEDDKRSFQLEDGEEGQIVMITSALCDDYEKGSDGYCLMVDKRPSITPLNVDMTRDVSIVENWYES